MSSSRHDDPFIGFEYQPFDFEDYSASLPNSALSPFSQDYPIDSSTNTADLPETNFTSLNNLNDSQADENFLGQNQDRATQPGEVMALWRPTDLLSNTTQTSYSFTPSLESTASNMRKGPSHHQNTRTGKSRQTKEDTRHRSTGSHYNWSSSGRIEKQQNKEQDSSKFAKAAKAACSALLELKGGGLPTETEILGLHLVFKTSVETLNQWFRRNALKDNASGSREELLETNLLSLFQKNQGKCHPLVQGDSSLERVEGRPFACTNYCGLNFRRKDDWRKHEERNFPQEVWLCREGYCQSLSVNAQVHFRMDKFREHLQNHHPHVQPTKENLRSYRFPIDSKFPEHCIFEDCHEKLHQWGERIDHIATHFQQPWTISQWRRPVSGQDKSRTTSESSGSEKLESGQEWDAMNNDSKDSNDSDHPTYFRKVADTSHDVSQPGQSSQPRRDRNHNGDSQHTANMGQRTNNQSALIDRLSKSLAVTHLDPAAGLTFPHPPTLSVETWLSQCDFQTCRPLMGDLGSSTDHLLSLNKLVDSVDILFCDTGEMARAQKRRFDSKDVYGENGPLHHSQKKPRVHSS